MSNKDFKKNLPPEKDFIKLQDDFCKVLDVFEHRGKKFTDLVLKLKNMINLKKHGKS